MNFFADEKISIHAVALLEVFDRKNEIRALKDLFARGTPDVEWIAEVSQKMSSPAILGGDGRILKNKAELAALRKANLTFVYLADGWTRIPFEVFAWKIIRAWPSITQNVERANKPTVFRVHCQTLKVERIGLVAELGKK